MAKLYKSVLALVFSLFLLTSYGQEDYSGKDLTSLNLAGRDFTGANLTGANLKMTNLTGTLFVNSNLTNADLRGTLLNITDFTNANLTGTDFSGAVFFRTTKWPTGFDLVGKGMFGPNLDYSGRDLSKNNLSGLDFLNANFTGANLSSQNLTYTVFESANLTNANLQNSYLNLTDFTNANLTGTDFTGAAFFRTTKWPSGFDTMGKGMFGPSLDYSGQDLTKINLSGFDFLNANFTGANLSSQNLTYTVFESANLTNANLQNSYLNLTDFTNANLTGTDFRGATFFRTTKWPIGFDAAGKGMFGPNLDYSGQDLTKINLSGRDFLNANFMGANLSFQNLTQTIFESANLAKANLQNSYLNLTDFSRANLTETDFRGSAFFRTTKWPESFDPIGKGMFGPYLDYSGQDLTKNNLSGRDFLNANFMGADLSSQNLTYTVFESANLTNANLQNSYLNLADFTDANLTGADLRGAAFFQTTKWPIGFNPACMGMYGPNLDYSGMDFRGKQTSDLDFYGANLSNVNLSFNNLTRSNFSEAILTNADLRSTLLSLTNFNNAILFGADFSTATIVDSYFIGAKYNSETKWPQGFLPANAGAILISGLNTAPENLNFSPVTLTSNSPLGSIAGFLSATDKEGGVLKYALDGCNGDNGFFRIEGDKVLTLVQFDPQIKSSYSIGVKVIDDGGLINRKVITIYILPSYVPQNGLMGWWPFNGNAKDESGNGNDGEVHGATLSTGVNGKINSAYYFDEIDFISGPTKMFPSGNSPRSISLWLNTPKLFSDDPGILGTQIFGYGGGSCGTSFIGYFAKEQKFEIQGHCAASFFSSEIPSQINNNWYNLVVVYDGSKISSFFNGILFQTLDVNFNTAISNLTKFYFGIEVFPDGVNPYTRDLNLWKSYFGHLDDIAVWNRALTMEEVTAIYRGTTQPPTLALAIPSGNELAYGSEPVSFEVVASPLAPVLVTSSNPYILAVSGNTLIIKGAGKAQITAGVPGTNLKATQTVTITKARLTVKGENVSRPYGEANPTLSYAFSGFKNSDGPSVIDNAPKAETTATQTSNAGNYPVTFSGGSDNNYELVYENGVLNVTKATLTVKGESTTRRYGEANPNLTYTYSGFKNDDGPSVIDTAPKTETTAVLISNVGIYPITLSGGLDNNYEFVYEPGVLAVTKATLTAKADNKERFYGEVNPDFTISYTGFKNTDGPSELDTAPTGTTTAGLSSAANVYAILASGGLDNNYDFIYESGVLTIKPAGLTVKAEDATKVYGDQNPFFKLVYSGFKNGEDASILDSQPTVSTQATLTSDAGGYPIIVSGGSDVNYALTRVDGLLTVTKAVLEVKAGDATRKYGESNPVFGVGYTGFRNGDGVGVIDVAPKAETTATAISNVGTYPISLNGGSDNNYTFAYQSGTLTVTKALLLAKGDDKSRGYGDQNPTLTISYNGLKNNETATILDAAPKAETSATVGSNVGTYAITVSGGVDNNYELSYQNGTLTINKATLTARADDKTRPYNTANPELTVSYSGFKNSENSSVIDTTPTATTTAQLNSIPGNYLISLSGASDNNYSFSYQNGTLTVTKLSQTVTFTLPATMFEDQSPYTLTASSTSNGPISYSVVEGNATITNDQLTISGPGILKINATQSGTSIYLVAEAVATTTVGNSYVVSGLITKPTNIPLGSGLAKLFYENGGLAKNGTVTNGNYSITLVRPGRYILQVVPQGNDDNEVFPAYYKSVQLNKDATVIVVEGNTQVSMEMPAKPKNEEKGPGEIKGKVVSGNGGGRFIVGRIANGTGLPNVPVYLLEVGTDKVLRTVNTDKDGLFTFAEVPTGNYRIGLDVVGATLANTVTTVAITPEAPVLEVSAVVSSQGGQPAVVLEVDVVTSLKEELGMVRVYPNPGEGDLMIRYQSSGAEVITFELSDMNGRSLKRVTESPNAIGEYKLPIGELRLSGGMYLLQVSEGKVVKTIKVIRK